MFTIDAILIISADGAEIEGDGDDYDFGPWGMSHQELSDAGWEAIEESSMHFVTATIRQNLDGSPQFISITKR